MPDGNPYCDALGIPVPCLEDLSAAREPSLFHWMVLALLEHGAPMRLDAIAERLDELAVQTGTGDTAYSLRKAWHGLPPVYQDLHGQFGLDTHDWRVLHIAESAGLVRRPVPVADPGPPRRADTEPMTVEEMEALFAEGIGAPSALRVTAAVLEAVGHSMTLDEVVAWVRARLRFGSFRLTPQGVRGWRSALVVTDVDGRLALNPAAPDLRPMRASIRDVVHPRLVRKAHADASQARFAAWENTRKVEARRLAEAAAGLRHALVHVVPDARAPAAVVVLDVEARTFHVTLGPLDPGALDAFDVLVGLDVRDTIQSIGTPGTRASREPWRLVDLRPPRKTRKLNRQGRTLEITTDLLLRGTTGMSLGEPARVASYLHAGDRRRLAARLEADAKALHAYYLYGRSHGYVRLRWGFLDERLAVEWALPGEQSLHDLLAQAHAEGRGLDVVLGSAPGWGEPWTRARPATVAKVGYGYRVEVDDREVPPEEIQALRLTECPATSNLK
ncbi:MAG: hypothetical protein ACOZNI_27105 [Myxococcota bacterium]